MKKIIIGIGVLVLAAAAFIGFRELTMSKGEDMKDKKIPLKTFRDISIEKLQKVAGKRIYFGHQSVGFNIINGLKELARAHPALQLKIIETDNLQEVEGPVFAHSRLGKNNRPKAKVDDFIRKMESGLKDQVDIAIFKFCFVDIHHGTNVPEVFNYYKTAMNRLKETYPHVTFIQTTVPYYRRTGGIKGYAKRILDRDRNFYRERFSQLMRSEFPARELFDLGRIESTYPDGSRAKGDKSTFALVPDYTDDGGHLNAKGREMVAVQLLDFLGNL